jgi:hypothetical protein
MPLYARLSILFLEDAIVEVLQRDDLGGRYTDSL